MAVAEQDLRPVRSQGSAVVADCDRPLIQNVRLRRLVLDRRGLQLVTDVHPSLTVVVVPPDQLERTRQLVSGALGGAEPGVHVELTDRWGRNLLLFRPHGGRSRVVDLDAQVDARPPVLTWRGPDDGPPPLAAEVVVRLSGVEQHRLWDAADRLAEALARRPSGAEEPCDGADAHGGAGRPRRTRLGRRAHRGAGRAPDATADATRAWQAVADDVPLDEALALRDAIEACAMARSRTVALAAVSSGPATSDDADGSGAPGDPAPVRVVAEALAALLGAPADTPQTLVLPPPDAAASGVQLLLDVLPELLGGRQVIAVTCDADVADWGRLEELAGRATTAQARCR